MAQRQSQQLGSSITTPATTSTKKEESPSPGEIVDAALQSLTSNMDAANEEDMSSMLYRLYSEPIPASVLGYSTSSPLASLLAMNASLSTQDTSPLATTEIVSPTASNTAIAVAAAAAAAVATPIQTVAPKTSPPPPPLTTNGVSSSAVGHVRPVPVGNGQRSVRSPLSRVKRPRTKTEEVVPETDVTLSTRLFQTKERFDHVLEASTSMMTPRGEDTVTYLNKAQFYSIHSSFNKVDGEDLPALVRSEVYLVFREEKDAQSELENWQFWQDQQANPNQRGLEIDQRSFKNVQEVDAIAYNAYAFRWNPVDTAKIVIRVNCLSTEFSSQKGVKGIPLFLMIDTYEDVNAEMDAEPAHRCYCKVKVFRDKGAERKNKDESRSADRRMAKILKQQSARKRPRDPATGALSLPADESVTWVSPGTVSPAPPPLVTWVSPGTVPPAPPLPPKSPPLPKVAASGFFQEASKVTHLMPTSTLSRKPVAFIPHEPGSDMSFNNKAASALLMSMVKAGEAKRTFNASLTKAADGLDDLDMGGAPRVKTARLEEEPPDLQLATPVTIYVRKEEEKVYNAIMLYTLTVQEVADNIGSRYGVAGSLIRNVYKQTKKGIIVNMENRMVQCFANEDDFVVRFEFDNTSGSFKLYLSY